MWAVKISECSCSFLSLSFTRPPPPYSYLFPSRHNYHPPGFDNKGKQQPTAPPPQAPGSAPPAASTPSRGSNENQEPIVEWVRGSDVTTSSPGGEPESGVQNSSEGAEDGSSGGEGGPGKSGAGSVRLRRKDDDVFGGGAVYGALGQAQEETTYELPKEWKMLVSTLCLRTNFEPAELADLFQRFRSLAGEFPLESAVSS